jgi:hypothetical protein
MSHPPLPHISWMFRVPTPVAALPIGGKFDICASAAANCRDKNGNLIIKPWDSPHFEHDKGTAVDVAVVSTQCSANYLVNSARFRAACVNIGGAVYTLDEGNHAHCRWAN